MASKKASEAALAELHTKLAEVLTEMLEDQEKQSPGGMDAEGNPTVITEKVKPSAGVLAVAAKFLKDNSIFVDPDQSDAMEAFADKLGRRKPGKQDLKDAMRQIGSDLIQ